MAGEVNSPNAPTQSWTSWGVEKIFNGGVHTATFVLTAPFAYFKGFGYGACKAAGLDFNKTPAKTKEASNAVDALKGRLAYQDKEPIKEEEKRYFHTVRDTLSKILEDPQNTLIVIKDEQTRQTAIEKSRRLLQEIDQWLEHGGGDNFPSAALVEETIKALEPARAESSGLIAKILDMAVDAVKDRIWKEISPHVDSINRVAVSTIGVPVYAPNSTSTAAAPAGAAGAAGGAPGAAAANAAGAAAAPAGAPAGQFNTVNGWVESLLNYATSNAASMLFQAGGWGGAALGASIIALLAKGKEFLENNTESLSPSDRMRTITVLDAIMGRLQSAQSSKSFAEWASAISECSKIIGTNKLIVLLNGMTIPTGGSTPESENLSVTLSRMIQEMKDNLQMNANLDEGVDQIKRSEHLIPKLKHVGGFFILHWLIEKLLVYLGGNSTFSADSTFPALMQQVLQRISYPNMNASEEEKKLALDSIEKEFYHKLDEAIAKREDIFWVAKLLIRWFALPFLNWFSKILADHGGDALKNYAEESMVRYEPKEHSTKFLDILEPAGNWARQRTKIQIHWATNPNVHHNLEQFIDTIYDKPSLLEDPNSGIEIGRPSGDILKDATIKLMDTYFPPLFIGSKIQNLISRVHSFTFKDELKIKEGASKEVNTALIAAKCLLINVPLQALLYPLYWVSKILDFAISNTFKWAAKQALVSGGGAGALLDQVQSSIYERSPYVHSFNVILLDVLNRACEALIKGEDGSVEDEDIPPAIRESLTALVKSILDTLKLQQNAGTPETLQRCLAGETSYSEKLKEILNDCYTPAFIDNMVKIIDTSSRELLKPENARRQYNSLVETVIDNMMIENRDPTNEELLEFKRTEDQIKEKLDFILRFTIEASVQEIYGSLGKSQKKISDEYIDWLKESLEGKVGGEPGFISSIEKLLQAVDQNQILSRDISFHVKNRQQLRDISSLTLDFYGNWLRKNNNYNGKLDRSSQDHINYLLSAPLKVIEALQGDLSHWHKHQDALCRNLEAREGLFNISETQEVLKDIAQNNVTEESLERLESVVARFDLLVLQAPEIIGKCTNTNARNYINNLVQEKTMIKSSLAKISNNKKSIAAYDKITNPQTPPQTDSLINDLVRAARNSKEPNGIFSSILKPKYGSSSEFNAKWKTFLEEIKGLQPQDEDYFKNSLTLLKQDPVRWGTDIEAEIRRRKEAAIQTTTGLVANLNQGGRLVNLGIYSAELQDSLKLAIAENRHQAILARDKVDQHLQQIKRMTSGLLPQYSLTDDEIADLKEQIKKDRQTLEKLQTIYNRPNGQTTLRSMKAAEQIVDSQKLLTRVRDHLQNLRDIQKTSREIELLNLLNTLIPDYEELGHILSAIESEEIIRNNLHSIQTFFHERPNFIEGVARLSVLSIELKEGLREKTTHDVLTQLQNGLNKQSGEGSTQELLRSLQTPQMRELFAAYWDPNRFSALQESILVLHRLEAPLENSASSLNKDEEAFKATLNDMIEIITNLASVHHPNISEEERELSLQNLLRFKGDDLIKKVNDLCLGINKQSGIKRVSYIQFDPVRVDTTLHYVSDHIRTSIDQDVVKPALEVLRKKTSLKGLLLQALEQFNRQTP